MNSERTLIEGLDVRGLIEARWFAGKGRAIERIELADAIALPTVPHGWLLLIDVQHDHWQVDRYSVPAYFSPDGRFSEPVAGDGWWAGLLEVIRGGLQVRGLHGVLIGKPDPELATTPRSIGERPLGIDQTNTSVVIGERHVAKLYRRLTAGPHPEIELVSGLTHAEFPHVPPYRGCLVHVDGSGEETAVVLVQQLIAGVEDPWAAPVSRLARGLGEKTLGKELTATSDVVADFARVAAKLHTALATTFGTTPATFVDLVRWRTEADAQLDNALDLLDGEPREELETFAPAIRADLAAIEQIEPPMLCRVHGDLHWGQFLRSADGIYVVDFEGEPTRSVSERRRLGSPMRDLACLVRSIDHLIRTAEVRAGREPGTSAQADAWLAFTSARCISAYKDELARLGSPLAFDAQALRLFEVEKECYEYVYAQTLLPSWLYAPRLGMRWLMTRRQQG